MTKQYTLIFILLGVLMFAVSAFTAAALREANTTYDLEALKAAQTALAQQVADQVAAQESAMAAWALEATTEVQTASTDVDALRRLTCESIVLAQVGGGTGTLDGTAVDDCMIGASAITTINCVHFVPNHANANCLYTGYVPIYPFTFIDNPDNQYGSTGCCYGPGGG